MKYFSQPSVVYVDHMGNDVDVVNSAKVSYNKYVDELDAGGEKLIKFLASHDHFTPFTHQVVKLRETVPIFTARQRFKHTVGFTYNEVSRRYIDEPPMFYEPSSWRVRAETNKQGSVEGKLNFHYEQDDMYELMDDAYRSAMRAYEQMLIAGVCPEQARMVLPLGMYTSYIVTGSLAAWARAYKLRIAKDSQKEIQDLAEAWERVIEPLFPVAWKELTNE